MTLEKALELDWETARLECLREAIAVLEGALRGPEQRIDRSEVKEKLLDLRYGLANRERRLKPF